jgi:methylenetetrahydrofolate reductase (NADPH)
MQSTLHRRLAAGQKVITGEIAPPRGAGRAALEKTAQRLVGYVDAVNLTENQRGMARMSALGAGLIVKEIGLEPIVQVTGQHRNRIALQADVLTGSALGIHNFTCMTGDHPKHGDHPEAKSVLDLNSFQIIRMIRTMRDEGKLHAGVALKPPPDIFVGAVANPNIERIARLERKLDAGAEFIQTQIIFDIAHFRTWMNEVREAGLDKHTYIIGGVMIMKHADTPIFIRDNLPGMRVPEPLIERMQQASNPEEEGIKIAAEQVQELLSIEGVAGVHIMSIGWTRAIPWVIEQAGILPRPPLPEKQTT